MALLKPLTSAPPTGWVLIIKGMSGQRSLTTRTSHNELLQSSKKARDELVALLQSTVALVSDGNVNDAVRAVRPVPRVISDAGGASGRATSQGMVVCNDEEIAMLSPRGRLRRTAIPGSSERCPWVKPEPLQVWPQARLDVKLDLMRQEDGETFNPLLGRCRCVRRAAVRASSNFGAKRLCFLEVGIAITILDIISATDGDDGESWVMFDRGWVPNTHLEDVEEPPAGDDVTFF